MIPAAMVPYLVRGLAGLVLVAAIGWGVHLFLESVREEGRAEVRAEYQKKLDEAKDEARGKEMAWNTQLEVARNEATKRQAENAASAAAAARTSARLRDALDTIARGLPADSAETLRGHADRLAEALGACDGEQRELAQLADQYWNAAKTLSDGWPNQ